MPLTLQFERPQHRHPTAPAVALGGRLWTYGQLADAARALDCTIQSIEHTSPINLPDTGRLMAIAIGNHAMAPAILTCAFTTAHAVAVLDPNWPLSQLLHSLKTVPPDVLFVRSDQAELRQAATNIGVRTVCVDHECDAILAAPPTRPPSRGTKGSTFLIGFTSGTTSRPKAFARSRNSWRESLRAGRDIFELDRHKHTLAPGPLAHGLTLYAFVETLDAGACFFGQKKFDAPAAVSILSNGQSTRLVAVPTMVEALCAQEVTWPEIQAVTTAGSKLSPPLLERTITAFPNAVISEYYGASELGFVSLNQHRNGVSESPPTSVGTPFAHVDLEIRHNHAPVPKGEIGTIFVRGDLAIDGYLGDQGQHGFRREGPWATVGDLGRLDGAGNLELIGREGGMVITGGYNVYPQEVTHVLEACVGVQSAMVFGIIDTYLGQRLIAVIQTDDRFEHGVFTAHLAYHLPRYKIPRTFYKVQTWPLTSSGKIARKTLEGWVTQKDTRLVPIDLTA